MNLQESKTNESVFYSFVGLPNTWVSDNDRTYKDNYFKDKTYEDFYFDSFYDMDKEFGHENSLFGTRGLPVGHPKRKSSSFDMYYKQYGSAIVRVVKDKNLQETVRRVLRETREEKIKNFIYSKFDIVFDELDLVIIYDQRFTTTMYGKWYNKENDEEVFHRNDWGILWIGKCGPYRKLRTYSKAVGLDFEGFEKVLIEYLNDKYKEQFNNKPVKSVGDEHFCLDDED